MLENLTFVDEVLKFKDDDQGSCIEGLKKVKNKFPNEEIIFCNGGDRNEQNIPEMSLKGIKFKFMVGGDDKKIHPVKYLKIGTIVKKREIGESFFNLFVEKNIKVKELIINPKKGMSFQKNIFIETRYGLFFLDHVWSNIVKLRKKKKNNTY